MTIQQETHCYCHGWINIETVSPSTTVPWRASQRSVNCSAMLCFKIPTFYFRPSAQMGWWAQHAMDTRTEHIIYTICDPLLFILDLITAEYPCVCYLPFPEQNECSEQLIKNNYWQTQTSRVYVISYSGTCVCTLHI